MPLSTEGQAFLDNFGAEKDPSASVASKLSPQGQTYLDSLDQQNKPDPGVFIPAVKRGFGQYAQSLANAGETVGLGTQGLTEWGNKIVADNPAQTPATLAGLAAAPWTAIKERTGEQLANLIPTIVGTAIGAAVGGPVGAAAGLEAGTGKIVGSYLGGALSDFPSEVGQVGLQQKDQGVVDTPRKIIGGLINTAIEMSPFGVEGAVAKVFGGTAEKAAMDVGAELVSKYATARAAAAAAGEPFVRNVAPTVMKSVAGFAGKALSIAAGEAGEEVPQNEVSRWSAHQDVLNKQSLQEDMDNAASAFAGSLLFGAAGGVQHQRAVNQAINQNLDILNKKDEFAAQPEGTQTTIPGTNPQQQADYVAWASNNAATVGDKRISRYGINGVVAPDATFSDVNDAIKTLETGAPVTALKVAPQITELEAKITDLTAKISDKVQQTQAQVADQQQVVQDATDRLTKTPNDPNLRAKVIVETTKLGRIQQKVTDGAPVKMTDALDALNTQKEALTAKVQPLNLETPATQVAAQEVQRQKVLDKLHQVRGDMAFFQDQQYQKTLDTNPTARDTLTRDLFDAADARDKTAQRASEFDQAQAQVDQQKQAQLDQVQAEAPPRTFAAAAPITEEPSTALGQALAAAQVTPEAQVAAPETATIAAPEVASAPVEAPVEAPVPVPAPAADNATALAQVYQDNGKTAKEAAALVRSLTKNIDVTDTQAVSNLLAQKANSQNNQTSFDTLDKLHKAVTGLSLNDIVKPEQATPEKTLGDKFTTISNMVDSTAEVKTVKEGDTTIYQVVHGKDTLGEFSTKEAADKLASDTNTFGFNSSMTAEQALSQVKNQFEMQKELTGKTVQQVARHIANTTPNTAYSMIAHRVEARLNALQKQGMKFSFNIATPENQTSNLPEGARGSASLSIDHTGSETSVWISGVGNKYSGVNHQTILHELVHAATQASIEFGIRAKEGTAAHTNVLDLMHLFNAVGKVVTANISKARSEGTTAALSPIELNWAQRSNNAFADLHELVAWALTDKDMQTLMESIKYTPRQTIWNSFVSTIREMLGLKTGSDTALSEILRVSDRLMTSDIAELQNIAQQHGYSLMKSSNMIDESAFNKEGYVTSDTELGSKIDSIVNAHPTLSAAVKQFLTVGATGTTSSVFGKGQRALEKNFQSPLHIASKSKGFSLTWDRVRQIPANAGYILNKAFAPLEYSWVKGMDVTGARLVQFTTGIENTTFQNLRRAEGFLHEWNVSGMTREDFMQSPNAIAKFGDMANNQDWYSRVAEARQAIDFTLDAQFKQNAEDMRSVITDDKEFAQWYDEANKVNENRKDTGYIPLRRYGDYSVAMYDTAQRNTSGFPSGDLGLMGKWFFQSELEAREFIKAAKEQFSGEPTVALDSDFTNNRPQYIPKAKSSQYSYSTISFRQFLETARRANVSISSTEQQRLAKLMINADSMYQNRIQQRKNIPGGSRDIVRSMSEFITHIANRVASDRMAPRISEAMNITHPLSPEEVTQLSQLHDEFQWTLGKSEAQIRDDIHDQVATNGGTAADEVTQLAQFNKMKELESNGFLAWRTSVDINDPQQVAEYYDLLARSQELSGPEVARFDKMSTPDPQAGFYHDKIAQHVDFLNKPKSEAFADLRRFAAINFLGASISAMIVNVSSLPLNFMPYMHQYGGMSAYTSTMHWFTKSLSDPMLRSTIFNNNTAELEKALSPEGKLPEGLSRDHAEALLRAFREEVVADTQVFEYFAAAKHGVQIGTVLGQRAQALWMSPFRISEMVNRVASFMAAYDIGKNNLIEGKQLGSEDLYQFARKAVDQTQFIYGPINRIGIAQNPVGFALMTFKAFPIMTIELMARLPAKQRTIMLGTMLLSSGVGGIPFKDDILDIIDTIGEKVFGAPLNSNRVLHNFFKNASEALTGTDLSRLIMTGPLDVLTGASIGSRVSMSNIIPATRIGTSGYSLADGMLDLSGVIGSEVKGLVTGAGQLVQGNVKEAITDTAPSGVKGVMRFTQGVNNGKVMDRNGNTLVDDLTMSELGLLGAGFTLSRSNWQQQKDYSITQEQAFVKETTASYFKHIADAAQAGDYQTMSQDFEAIQQWNKNNPEYPYKINPTTLHKELLMRSLPAGQREMMKMKKAWRGSASEDLLSED